MKIYKLIRSHSQALDRTIDDNPMLLQRLKARLQGRKQYKYLTVLTTFRRYALLYGFLFVVFTILGFLFINGVSKTPPRPAQQVALSLDAFQPSYPGSITYAYEETMNE